MEQLLIWGAGGHAKVVADIVRLEGRFEIAGFVDEHAPLRRGERFGGATVLGGSDELPALLGRGVRNAIVAIGDCTLRLARADHVRQAGLKLASAIHPRAIVAESASVSSGSVLCAGAIIGVAAVIGESVIVNTGATVDHECQLADGVHIGPGAHLGGCVTVGRGAWVGIGASVREGVRIGAGVMVGAGAAVIGDVAPGEVVLGVPARPRARTTT